MAAVQKRVGVTRTVLANIRSVKMMGLSKAMSDTLQDLRLKETDCIGDFRWDIVWQNVVANVPLSLTPPAAFAVYAVNAARHGNLHSLDVVQVFTSLSVMRLVTEPAASLLGNTPMTASGIGSFDRIQKFLLEPARQDQREILFSSTPDSHQTGSCTSSTDGLVPGQWAKSKNGKDHATLDNMAISASNLVVRPAASAADIVLRDVSFQLRRQSITVVLGPVASGKSTLLRAILGEVQCEGGAVRIADDRIAYCAQTPWLPNKTIRKTICGPITDIDETWYRSCLQACALNHDLGQLPDGDESWIGSDGMTLSGGQKHRIALARALYARAKIVVLDDILSELDTITKNTVVQALFADGGMFRKLGSTVVLVTHDSKRASVNVVVVLAYSLTESKPIVCPMLIRCLYWQAVE